VALSANALANATDHYTFASSVSVHRDFRIAGIDEAYPVGELEKPTEVVDERTYGPLKALCEQAVEAALPDRALIVRPGLIVGPHDPTDRFTYWPERVAQGGEILAPEPRQGPVQFTDVRDLAEWLVRLIESRTVGCYNATGPEPPVSMERLLRTCQTVSGTESRITWVDESFLLDEGVGPWIEVPLWIPLAPDDIGANRVSIRQALTQGLTFRPIEDTVRDTLEWARARSAGERKAGLKPEREAELLAKWHASQSG
jgi:2'-hydroxyisoflavone reductase